MDPVTATIGLVSGVGTIVGVIGRSLSTLNTLRVHASDAELNIELLIGQLQTVQAALRQVQAFLSVLSAPLCLYDQQLISDLDGSLSHCKLLVQYIDNQISKLAWTPGSRITGQKLLHLILEDKATKDCLTRLDHQISALNLCLTAFRCRSLSTTNRMPELEAHPVLADTDETPPGSSSSSNALSRTSSTDQEESSRSISPTSTRTTSPTDRKPSIFGPLVLRDKLATSARLDSLIKKDATKRYQILRILALGHNRSSVVKQLRLGLGEKLDEDELNDARRSIVQLVTLALLSVVQYVEDTSGGFVSEQSCKHLGVLRQFARSAAPSWRVEAEVAQAAKSVWGNWFVQQAFQNMNHGCRSAYFLKSTVRVMQPAYVPSSTDIIRAPDDSQIVKDTRLELKGVTVDLVEPPQSNLAKILHQFEDLDGCLAYVDISSYDRYLHDEDRITALQRTFNYLRAVFRTGMFSSKAVFLCISNTVAFQQKLPTSPLKAYFPDYAGGNDAKLAVQYLVKQCKQAITADFLYTHVAADEEDPTTVKFFRNKAEGLRTALELTRYMGFFASSNQVPKTHVRRRNHST